MKKLLPVLAFLAQFPAFSLTAQKIEVERPVSPAQLPDSVFTFLDLRFSGRQRVNYYLERNETGLFYEVKFLLNRRRYSVKFTNAGRHVDTERIMSRRQLPEALGDAINRQLGQRLSRFRILKIQEQLKEGKVQGYELELRGKSKNHFGRFEAHFTTEGHFLDLRTMEEPPNDFLFF